MGRFCRFNCTGRNCTIQGIDMVNESIEKQRQRVFSQCRRLMKKINDTAQTILDNSACQCCEKPCPAEDLTEIDSGQLLCPICFNALKQT